MEMVHTIKERMFRYDMSCPSSRLRYMYFVTGHWLCDGSIDLYKKYLWQLTYQLDAFQAALIFCQPVSIKRNS